MTTVSVVIPTCNRYNTVIENIGILRKQTHPVEIIICDDSHISDYKKNKEFVDKVKTLADNYFYTTTYDHAGNKLYGLGRARNTGIIEAVGDIIVFLDDRIAPAIPTMIEVFANEIKESSPKVWLFGDKGAQKQSFVENCSAVRRREIINSGMFPETINSYGFMTREVYARHVRQGFEFIYVPEAKAKPIRTGSRRNNPERKKQIEFSISKLKKMRLK